MRLLILLLTLFFFACGGNNNPLHSVILEDDFLEEIASNADHEIQIIYTMVDRDENQNPSFTSYFWGLDSSRYFYPASTVKFPASLLALEKINQLGFDDLNKFSRMVTDSAFSRQTRVFVDSSAADFNPSVAQYIKKILLVSDNDAYNRLYEFLGQDYFNQSLRSKGYSTTRILHRLSLPRTVEENLNTNPISFYNDGLLVYEQSLVKSSGEFLPDVRIPKGVGYISGDSLVNEPMDFAYKNYFPLFEQHRMIQSIIFPKSFEENTFQMSADDREFVLRHMSITPDESDVEMYQDPEHYYDAYCKFLIYGSQPGDIPDHIRIFNKIGLAYGYVIDNAYIVDLENNIEFFLSAVIHTNANKIFNDGEYEYDEIAFPFMAELGQALLDFEKERPRNFQADLSSIKALYK